MAIRYRLSAGLIRTPPGRQGAIGYLQVLSEHCQTGRGLYRLSAGLIRTPPGRQGAIGFLQVLSEHCQDLLHRLPAQGTTKSRRCTAGHCTAGTSPPSPPRPAPSTPTASPEEQQPRAGVAHAAVHRAAVAETDITLRVRGCRCRLSGLSGGAGQSVTGPFQLTQYSGIGIAWKVPLGNVK